MESKRTHYSAAQRAVVVCVALLGLTACSAQVIKENPQYVRMNQQARLEEEAIKRAGMDFDALVKKSKTQPNTSSSKIRSARASASGDDRLYAILSIALRRALVREGRSTEECAFARYPKPYHCVSYTY